MISLSKILDRPISRSGQKFDTSLLWMTVLMTVFSLVMIYSWEHMAFVTAVDNYVGNSYRYYDYKVVQHTNNYHLWTSNSGNGWEDVGSDGGRYGRIRD